MIRLKFKNRVPYFPEDDEYFDLEFKGEPVPEVLLDDDDLEEVLERRWTYWDRNGRLSVKNEVYLGLGERHLNERKQWVRGVVKRKTELHRFVLGLPKHAVIPINGSYLDCRKENYTFFRRDLAAEHARGVPFAELMEREFKGKVVQG